jgi:hypothetical protein
MNVHHEVADGTPGAERDLGMPAAYARKAIDTIDDHRISSPRYALDGDCVVT